ncbi:hypothetical protein [Streptomyces phaeochromogenes]|uniref:hypothetical protein n=1 Tax=Streptomyces phaeochromogenes TaxID=1923 RepID=UPI0033DEA967|nr:hypothetical protein OG478_40655 [Streptomyces phaeochromogenes]WSW13403.1 hypothetical protein OG277_10530 [Streptomyces phaeochromogenes]
MTRRIRNRKTLVVAVLATAALAAGGVALAADGDEAPRETVRFVVEEHAAEEGAAEEGAADNGTRTWTREDCPDKDGTSGTPSADPSNPAAAL